MKRTMLYSLSIIALSSSFSSNAMEMKTDASRMLYANRIQSEAINTEDLNDLQAELARELPKGRELTAHEKRALAEENRKNVMGKAGFKSFGTAPQKPVPQMAPQACATQAPTAPKKSAQVEGKVASTHYSTLTGYSEVDLSTAESNDEVCGYGALRSVLDEELVDEADNFYSQTVDDIPVAVQAQPKKYVGYSEIDLTEPSADESQSAFESRSGRSAHTNSTGAGNKSPRFKLGAKRENTTVTQISAQALMAKKARERALTEQSQVAEKPKSPRSTSPRSATLGKSKSPRGISEPKIVNRTVLEVNDTDWDRRFRKAYNMAIMGCTHKPQGDAEEIYKKMVQAFQRNCELLVKEIKETGMIDETILKSVFACTTIEELAATIGCDDMEHFIRLLDYINIAKSIEDQCNDGSDDKRLAAANRDFAATFMAFVEERLALSENFKPEFYRWFKGSLSDAARFV